jgi:hypothetical protein
LLLAGSRLRGKPGSIISLVVVMIRELDLLTLFKGRCRDEAPKFLISCRRRIFADVEYAVRLCALLEKSSLNRCCRHAWEGHMIRPVAVLVKKHVPDLIMVYRYAFEQVQEQLFVRIKKFVLLSWRMSNDKNYCETFVAGL